MLLHHLLTFLVEKRTASVLDIAVASPDYVDSCAVYFAKLSYIASITASRHGY